ncbi:MAG: hypothetical protein KC422_06280 [Trueperaceae bacterium]|nr:hypothetical protein [Trueperaceae bacterium]
MNLDAIPIFDHHAHALFKETYWRSEPIEGCYTEAYDPQILEHFVHETLYFRRSIRELATYYDCEAKQEAVLEARQNWNYQELAQKMFAQANISHWLIDDGIWVDRLMSVKESAEFIPVKVKRVLRLEAELAKFIERFDQVDALLEAFQNFLYQEAPSLAGFKSIIAYRTGLNIQRPAKAELNRSFDDLRKNLKPGELPRVNTKALLDECLWLGAEVAAKTQKPLQFHTGYGDPDLDMRLANPLHLRTLLEAPDLRGLNVVMLHCYPYIKEAGYLASVYSGAYLDLGLTIPYTSRHAMRTSVHEALHLSPISKVLFSTDAQRSPEMFYLAAKWAREVIGEVLTQTVKDDDLTHDEAYWAAERILFGNAFELYGAEE